MRFWTKLFIATLAIAALIYVKIAFFDEQHPQVDKKLVNEELVVEETESQKPVENTKKEESKKVYVTVYFLGIDKSSNGVFKKVKRPLPEGKNQLTYALQELIAGPNNAEKKQGVFSEIPKNVKLLSVVQSDKKIIINFSENVQNGGGADSLYSRMKQIIKTALANSPNVPIYLYLNGKQADVLGGEGIMITQPLNENSLDD